MPYIGSNGGQRTPRPSPSIMQTLLKPVMIKVNGNWQKLYKDSEVPARYTSWKSINLMIDAALDAAAYDHTILHKPFMPVVL